MGTYDREFLVGLYRTMLRMRICEESFVAPILAREVRCPVHLYSGQEAVATGVCAALETRDYVFGSHRSHGHYLAKGGDLGKMVAEIYCKSTGCARGRGGSMHVIDTSAGMMGAAPIVAGTISLAVGAAYAASVRGEPSISVSFFGDGATGEGVLYESMNLASVLNLPVLFVCENNLYSTHLPIRECRKLEEVHQVSEPFGIPAHRVDGNDVLAVYEVAENAVKQCRSGRGPVFIEALTYRMRGHVGPDDNIQGSHIDIRPPEEIARWRDRDPIEKLRALLLGEWGISEAELARLNADLSTEVEAAVSEARTASFPGREELAYHVFPQP